MLKSALIFKSAFIFKDEHVFYEMSLFSGDCYIPINSKLYRTKSVRLNSPALNSTSRCGFHLSVLK